MYPICYRQVSGGYLQPEPTMYSRCFHWFPGPLAPSVAPIFPGFIPFAISTGQRCVLLRNLRKVYHPYKDPVGWCCCEPGGWCDDLPCSSRKRCISCQIRGRCRGLLGCWGECLGNDNTDPSRSSGFPNPSYHLLSSLKRYIFIYPSICLRGL